MASPSTWTSPSPPPTDVSVAPERYVNDLPYERAGMALVSTDRSRIDVDLVHRCLAGTYWAAGIPRDVVVRSIENSLAFGMYEGQRQIGFARVVTDLATYGYLADVFVVEECRGRGLGEW